MLLRGIAVAEPARAGGTELLQAQELRTTAPLWAVVAGRDFDAVLAAPRVSGARDAAGDWRLEGLLQARCRDPSRQWEACLATVLAETAYSLYPQYGRLAVFAQKLFCPHAPSVCTPHATECCTKCHAHNMVTHSCSHCRHPLKASQQLRTQPK